MTENQDEIRIQDISLENQYGLSSGQTKELITALAEDDREAVKSAISSMHTADIADFINIIPYEKRRALIDIIRDNFNPEILVELDDPDLREEIFEFLGTKDSAEAIGNLETDDAVDVIEDLDHDDRREILAAIPQKQRADLEESLAHPEDSAGRLIDKKVVSVPEFWDVGQTIDYLRSEEKLPDEFYQIFVIDPKLKPIGGVLLSRVIRSKRSIKMKDIMETDLKLIRSDMDQEEVAFIFRQYGLASAPVVNEDGRMIGVITVDDVVDVIEEEAEEDIMRLGGISETDLHSSFVETMQRRFPWLMINLLTAILASVVISQFEGSIERLAALAVLMPIAASMGGNAGIQTLTVAVRAIATKELTSTNAWRVIGKEMLVGGLQGLAFAIITGIMVYAWYQNLYLSFIFAGAMLVTLLVAGLSGAMIPILLERMRVDPAIASSIFLTTITDVVAFGVFLGFAAVILW